MDNPHMREVDLAYLAGIIDGEGTITLERNGNRRLSGVMGLTPKVIVANTNEALIQRVVNVFTAIGSNPHIKTQAHDYAKRRRMMNWVVVAGLAKSGRVLRPLLPYLIAKKAQAQLVLEFIEIRGDRDVAKGKPYGEREVAILEAIRALNFRRVTETEDHNLSQI